MADLRTNGWVSSDVEVKKSIRQKLYVHFRLGERVGFRETARTQYYDVWAWGQTAQSLIDGSVRKGSSLWVRGTLELVAYTKRDGVTKDKGLKLKLDSWHYTHENGATVSQPEEDSASSVPETPSIADVVDGEREALPE